MSRRRRNLIIGAAAVALALALGAVAWAWLSIVARPEIYRAKGTVVSATSLGPSDGAKVCLTKAVKAPGSTYGSDPSKGNICMQGLPSRALPPVGSCTVVGIVAEGSTLTIESATGCR